MRFYFPALCTIVASSFEFSFPIYNFIGVYFAGIEEDVIINEVELI